MARHAGASPARPPRMQMRMAEEMAVQKSTWKWAVRMPSVVLPTSSICRMATPKRMPLMPATKVRRILSEMICESIILGVAPMARRMPISVVRSFTVTINIFNEKGAQGTISGSELITKQEAGKYDGKYMSGSYLRPFTVEFSAGIKF